MGSPAVWVDNQEFWPRALHMGLSSVRRGGDSSVSLAMPGTIVAVGHKDLSFIAEIPGQWRVVEAHGRTKQAIRDNERASALHQIWVPRMIICAQFSAAYSLNLLYAFYTKLPEDVPFHSDEYLDQQLYYTGLHNFWEDSRMCNPAEVYQAPAPTITSMLNTAIEAMFGSSFNYDMSAVNPPGISWGSPLYSDTIRELYEKWEALSPEEVDAIAWTPMTAYGKLRDFARKLRIEVDLTRPNNNAQAYIDYSALPKTMGTVARDLSAKEQVCR